MSSEKEKVAKEKQAALENSRKSLNIHSTNDRGYDRDYDRRRDDDYGGGRSSHREDRYGNRGDGRESHRRDDRHYSDGRRDRDVSREREHQRWVAGGARQDWTMSMGILMC